MDGNKYIKSIVKNLRCSKTKREDIKKQLESDVQAAMENGETLEEIQIRMGTPENVAKEFNGNFSEEELKAAGKNKKGKALVIVGVILLILILVICWWWPRVSEVGSDGTFNKEDVESQSELIINLLDKDDFEGLCSYSNDTMKTVLEKKNYDDLKTAKAGIGSDWGAFRSYGKVYMTQISQMGKKCVIVQMNASYENVSVTYTITFDEDMKLAGLYMK